MQKNKVDYQICSRCVMDNQSDDTIVFAADGTCNYCTDVMKRMPAEYFPNEEGQKALDAMMHKIKTDCVNDEFDCLVGISGGLDSSYILHIGYTYGLRMLAVHIDDELDTPIAVSNIEKICKQTNTKLICVKPPMEQYKDLVLSFLKASVPNLAMPQDNLIVKALRDVALKYRIKYALPGGNFSMESILQRGCTHNAFDVKHIKAISREFGNQTIDQLKFSSFFEHYIIERYSHNVQKFYPLNYIDYNMKQAISVLKENYGYEYYGGKHYESILTRFLQCYYLPTKFQHDKRKSHYSSLIMSNQMTRAEALEKLATSAYTDQALLEADCNALAQFLNISRSEFDMVIALPPKQHDNYPISFVNTLAPLARKIRKYLG